MIGDEGWIGRLFLSLDMLEKERHKLHRIHMVPNPITALVQGRGLDDKQFDRLSPEK